MSVVEKRYGTIRKWVPAGAWGIVNSYPEGSQEPQRFFVHISRVISPDALLGLGVRIRFVVGPPRNPGELPAALEIEIAPSSAKSAAEVQ